MHPRSAAVHTVNINLGFCNVSMVRERYPHQGSSFIQTARCWTAQCQTSAPWKQIRMQMLQRHTSPDLMSHQRPQSLLSDRTGQLLRVSCRASGSTFSSDRIQQVEFSRGPAELGGSAGDQSSASSLGSQDSSGSDDAPVQFEIHRIAGDGSCLFRAIAQGAHHVSTGSLLSRRKLFEAGFDLRREVCAEMVRRRKDIEPFIPGVFDAYVSNMSLEGIWGGEPELAVAIHCIQRPIIVYKEVKSGLLGKDLEKVSEYGAEQYPGVSPVCLLYSGLHYDLLMQVVQ